MNYCKRCRKKINDKYEYCWDCNEFLKNESKKNMKTFTCTKCHQTMYSMIWPGKLCCSCYSYSIAKKRNLKNEILKCVQERDLNSLPLKTLEDDVHET